MSKRLKRKAAVMVAVEILCIVLLGAFLMVLQTNLSVRTQHKDMKEKLSHMQELIDNADAADAQNTASYDEVYMSKAASVAFMAQNEEEFQVTDGNMKALAEMMNVTNILVLDKEGKVLASGEKSAADFTYERFNQLRTVFDTNEPSEPFTVVINETERRYYAAKIDADTEVVVEHDPDELLEIQDSTSSWESILSKVSVGLEGYAFAVSSQDYTFLYHPDEELVGTDALTAGLKVDELEDGKFGWMDINGQRSYCGVTNMEGENAYVICMVPESEIISSRNITVAVVLFVFFVVISIVIIYAVLLLREDEKKSAEASEEEENPDEEREAGKLYYNRAVGRKISAISLVGVVIILVVSFYMQNLFSISRHSMSINQRVAEVEKNIARNNREAEDVTKQYNRRYLNKCQVASYILSGHEELWTKEKLQELSRALDVEFLVIFDKNGREVVSDSTYVNFEVSQNPEDQSYEFGKLLQGVEYVIQEAQPDELSGEFHQYIGVTLKDEKGNADGFVQISVTPSKLEKALATTQIASVLKGVKIGTNGFAFGVNKENKTISYYPQEKLIGREAAEYGIGEEQLRDGYSDYLEVNGKKYYGSCLEADYNYIYAVVPDNEMNDNCLPIALVTAAVSLICLILAFIILTLNKQAELKPEDGQEAGEGAEDADGQLGDSEGPMIDVVMPDGTVRQTDTAASRWSNLSVGWAEKTPEQKVGFILKSMVAMLALFICAAVVFKDVFFDSNSIFLYVINGGWHRGVNIFAITGCIMIICVLGVAVMAVREVLRLLSRTFGARGETICRLLSSFLKYFGVIAGLYYCFALFGVDTQTLLASAGILSLVIGLGAKSLVEDILAGLFIIFEGDFRVGDIVTVGDWRGTVMEIGIRTTKIEEPGNNVKIFNNSAISGIINMTRKNSFASCDVGIEYGESIERVENILSQELPRIKERVPAIKDGPFYKGVVALGDNSVNIKIVAQCAEGDRVQVIRDLNREMKIIFDRHDINIPFPQVVINQPKEYQKATVWDKVRADEFNKEQKELTKSIKEEQRD